MSEAVNPKAYPLADAQVRMATKGADNMGKRHLLFPRSSSHALFLFCFAADQHHHRHRPAGVQLQAVEEGSQ